MKLKKMKLFDNSIYRLKLLKLKRLKAYIEINLANSFIKSFKSLAKALIFAILNLIGMLVSISTTVILIT